jgi:hypothetical protein
VTDDRFGDYVDEESISDFAAQDVDTGSDLEDAGTDPGTDPGIDREPDTNIDGAIEASGAWALPDATGVPSVDAAITELARLDELPISEHVGVYEGLHRQLQDALADLDGS